jgi:hypothetical protein
MFGQLHEATRRIFETLVNPLALTDDRFITALPETDADLIKAGQGSTYNHQRTASKHRHEHPSNPQGVPISISKPFRIRQLRPHSGTQWSSYCNQEK